MKPFICESRNLMRRIQRCHAVVCSPEQKPCI